MSKAASNGVKVVPVEREDIPTIAQIACDAFEDDSHTRFKMYEQGTDDMKSQLGGEAVPRQYFENPKVLMWKAIDTQTGEILGFTNWAKWNFDKEPEASVSDGPALDAPITPPATTPDQTPIETLGALTSGHLKTMGDRFNTPSTRNLYALGFCVSPKHHSKGIGSALLAEVTAVADKHAAGCWIHLSDSPAGVKALQRAGFKEVNSLSFNLDDYRVKEREGPWGTYTHHYFLRGVQQP